ncbi:hypothetical protein BS78_10G247900 [Paspalum vaginatum]|nr:hypothetical protein BS78_10G247900 [Paspalum vaginatum]
MQQKPPMATRPSLRSSDGTRPRSRSGNGRPPSSPRSSDPSRPSTGRSSAAAASDKPVPSFLRPTVSSSLHSSSSSSSLASPSSSSSSSKGTMAKRSADKAPVQTVIAPRPITPKAKAPASSSTSRWSAVSPRQLMQRASNALKATTKSREKKSKDAASTAASASGKGAAGASGGAKSETVRAQHVKALRQQPETPTEPSPSVTPVHEEEPVLLEPKDVEQAKQYIATSQEAVVTTVEVRDQEEHVNAQQLEGEVEGEAIEEKKTMPEEAVVVKAAPPELELQEEKPQSSAVAETETDVLKEEEDESPAVVVEEVKEEATPEGEDEPTTSAMEEKVVEETNSKKSQQEDDALKPTENSVTSVISEERPDEGSSVISEERKEKTSVISDEPKEADPAPIRKHGDVAEEAKVEAAGSSASAPTTPLKEAAHDDVEAVHRQVSASEPVTPVAEGVSKGKAVIDEQQQQQSALAPVTPVNAAKKHEPSKQQATIPEESALAFTGRKVKTAMEKRSDEEQPKKKEVARSNDVIEEAKSKLMEKRKSKVLALVGAFETVMDSPRAN